MRVTDDETLSIELLRCRIKVGSRVDEVPSFKVVDGHNNGEVLVGRDRSTVRRVNKLARGHIRLGGDLTHGDRIAASSKNLCTIGNGLTDTEVDVIVGTGQRWDLTGFWRALLSILGEAGTDNRRIEGQRRLQVATTVIVVATIIVIVATVIATLSDITDASISCESSR